MYACTYVWRSESACMYACRQTCISIYVYVSEYVYRETHMLMYLSMHEYMYVYACMCVSRNA